MPRTDGLAAGLNVISKTLLERDERRRKFSERVQEAVIKKIIEDNRFEPVAVNQANQGRTIKGIPGASFNIGGVPFRSVDVQSRLRKQISEAEAAGKNVTVTHDAAGNIKGFSTGQRTGRLTQNQALQSMLLYGTVYENDGTARFDEDTFRKNFGPFSDSVLEAAGGPQALGIPVAPQGSPVAGAAPGGIPRSSGLLGQAGGATPGGALPAVPPGGGVAPGAQPAARINSDPNRVPGRSFDQQQAFAQSLINAQQAIASGKNRDAVIQRMVENFPAQELQIRRLLGGNA